MATRCTIKITGPDTIITLYRHWDGYPAETGRHLARVLRGRVGGTARDLAAELLAVRESYVAPWDSEAAAIYEITHDELRHGDTEYRYRVWLAEGEAPGFQVFNRVPGEAWHAISGGCAAVFRALVARELRDMRRRIAAFKRQKTA